MATILKKFSDFLGISDPEYVRAPPLDGEIIFCKNNVCVHPPSMLSTSVEHHPGYLTIRAQKVDAVADLTCADMDPQLLSK